MLYSTHPEPTNVGKLMTEPNENESQDLVERAKLPFVNNSQRFLLQNRNFERQYAHLYTERLFTMRDRVADSARMKWGVDDVFFINLYGLCLFAIEHRSLINYEYLRYVQQYVYQFIEFSV